MHRLSNRRSFSTDAGQETPSSTSLRPGNRGNRAKVLVVGQTPPPYHGQAMMIESLVNLDSDRLEIHHVRMSFSSTVQSVGRFKLGKLVHLAAVIGRALYIRYRHGTRILYYVPAGPHLVPILRDLVLLLALRLWFRQSVFHFHAAGLSELIQSAPKWLRWLAFKAYGKPDLAIQNSELNPPDAVYFGARHVAIIPNGISDAAAAYLPVQRPQSELIQILYVGSVQEQKGVMLLLEAIRQIATHRTDLSLWIMGEFASLEFESQTREFCERHSLTSLVSFVGQQLDDAKWKFFSSADLLCFPTYFAAESFGNVVLEAMMFELPVVATRWRGIPDLVDDEKTGLLVPPKDASALALAVERLMDDQQLRRRLGERARQKFLERFTLSVHLCELEQVLTEIAEV